MIDLASLSIKQLLDLKKKSTLFEGIPGQKEITHHLDLELAARKPKLDLVGFYEARRSDTVVIRVRIDQIDFTDTGDLMIIGKFFELAVREDSARKCTTVTFRGESPLGIGANVIPNLETGDLVLTVGNQELKMYGVPPEKYGKCIEHIFKAALGEVGY